MKPIERIEFWSYSGRSYEDFIGFVKRYLAPHMKMPFVEEDYYRELWDSMWSHRKIVAMISRGHSKSELLAVWATIYIACYRPFNPFYEKAHGEKMRIQQQLVFSSDSTVTNELFDRIKDYFVADDTLCQLLPKPTAADKNNTEKLELNNGSTIFARSIKMKRGLHIDRAVGDDLTTESSTLSDDETMDFFLGAFMPMTTAKQAMIMIDGTPIRITDINTRLSSTTEFVDWHKIKLPAIKNDGSLLSPKRFTKQMLDEIRLQSSVKFECEYMLNPIDDSVSLIKREWVLGCYNNTFDVFPHRSFFEETYLGVDFAFSDRKTADYSVFCIIGKSKVDFYLLNYYREQGMSGMEQLQYIQELNKIYRFDMIGLEENSIQAITKEVRELRLPIKLFRTGSVDERDKNKPDLSGVISVSKRNLILRLGTTFENKQIILPTRGYEAKKKADQLLQECISWAMENGKVVELGVHPDIPIALGYALEVATKNTFFMDFATML